MNRSRVLGSILSLAAAASMAVVSGPAATAETTSEEKPDKAAILEKCGDGADWCGFHPEGAPRKTFATAKKVSPTVPHCEGDGSFNGYYTEEKHTVKTERSVGGSVIAGVEGGLPGIAEVEAVFEAGFGHGWFTSKSYADAPYVNPDEGYIGWLELSAPVYEYQGVYELHFEDKTAGHYIWYIPSTITVPRDFESGETHKGWVVQQKKMTEAEKENYCQDKEIGNQGDED